MQSLWRRGRRGILLVSHPSPTELGFKIIARLTIGLAVLPSGKETPWVSQDNPGYPAGYRFRHGRLGLGY